MYSGVSYKNIMECQKWYLYKY